MLKSYLLLGGLLMDITTAIGMTCAKLTIPLTILVCIIFVLRMVGKKRDKQNWLNRLNRRLRKMHIPLGIALAVTAFVHAIFSSTGIFAPIWGALCLIFLVLTCLTWLFRKKKGFSFMKWHRALTVVFLITLVLHLAELPALKAENSSESRGGESYSQTQLNE